MPCQALTGRVDGRLSPLRLLPVGGIREAPGDRRIGRTGWWPSVPGRETLLPSQYLRHRPTSGVLRDPLDEAAQQLLNEGRPAELARHGGVAHAGDVGLEVVAEGRRFRRFDRAR